MENESKRYVLYLKKDEAVALVKKAKAGSRFFAHYRADAPVVNEKGDPTGNVFPLGLHSYLRLSRAQALKLVSDLLSQTLEDRAGRIPISVRDTYYYWIG